MKTVKINSIPNLFSVLQEKYDLQLLYSALSNICSEEMFVLVDEMKMAIIDEKR